MSETLERWLDASVGETRAALVRGGRAIAITIRRASEDGRRARWGEVYAARVRTVDKRLRGAFVDLGLRGDTGFLPLDAGGAVRRRDGSRAPVREGDAIVVSVAREGARDKGPVLQLLSEAHPGGAPRRISRHESDDALEGAAADLRARAALDAAIAEALSPRVALKDGGALVIEPTAALVAVDVDAAGRKGSGDPEKFALDLNIAAAWELARQLRLRNLGGIVAVDFVSLRAHASRAALEAAVKEAFAGDPWGVQTTRLSRFGVMELARAQLCAPLHERLCEGGVLSLESAALSLLRAIESAGAAERGRRIEARAPPDVLAWLQSAPFDWRGALDERLGARWAIEAASGAARESIDVRAL